MFQVQHHADEQQGSVWGGVNNPAGPGKAIDQGFGRYNPTLEFVESYEIGDPRLIHNISRGKLTANNETKFTANVKQWYPHKFRFTSKPIGRFITDMNAPVLRYGDVVMVFAEAAANYDGKTADAITALNMILARAQNGGSVPALVSEADFATADALKDFIFDERARELCFEGTSKFDLMRAGWSKFEEILTNQSMSSKGNEDYSPIDPATYVPVDWKDNVKERHILFPIPEAEMATNSALADQQNPGYN